MTSDYFVPIKSIKNIVIHFKIVSEAIILQLRLTALYKQSSPKFSFYEEVVLLVQSKTLSAIVTVGRKLLKQQCKPFE